MVRTVGSNIIRIRKLRKLSQVRLGKRLGVQQPGIWKLEHTAGMPEGPTLLRLAKALECSVEDLLVGVDADYDSLVVKMASVDEEPESTAQPVQHVEALPDSGSTTHDDHRSVPSDAAALTASLVATLAQANDLVHILRTAASETANAASDIVREFGEQIAAARAAAQSSLRVLESVVDDMIRRLIPPRTR